MKILGSIYKSATAKLIWVGREDSEKVKAGLDCGRVDSSTRGVMIRSRCTVSSSKFLKCFVPGFSLDSQAITVAIQPRDVIVGSFDSYVQLTRDLVFSGGM